MSKRLKRFLILSVVFAGIVVYKNLDKIKEQLGTSAPAEACVCGEDCVCDDCRCDKDSCSCLNCIKNNNG